MVSAKPSNIRRGQRKPGGGAAKTCTSRLEWGQYYLSLNVDPPARMDHAMLAAMSETQGTDYAAAIQHQGRCDIVDRELQLRSMCCGVC